MLSDALDCKQDVDILDEYRTVVPVGMMKLVYDKVEKGKIKSNIYELQKLIFSYEQSVKRTHNPKDETDALKADSSAQNFQLLRRAHHFRHDFPWFF